MTPTAFDRTDAALLGAYLLTAALGTWTSCLLLNDGAVLITAGWLGDAWDLYFGQIAGRAISLLIAFGPAWAARAAFGLSIDAYVVMAHALYFAAPLGLWLIVRFVEPCRLFSRLYLAILLPLVYFPTELIPGLGLWMIWAAWISRPDQSIRRVFMATMLLGVAMVFTHPSLALLSLSYAGIGALLRFFERPVPRTPLVAAALLGLMLLGGYVFTSIFFPSTNPTIAAALAVGRYDHVNPVWMLATLGHFPLLAMLWLLLLAPGAIAADLRWQLSPVAVLVVAALGIGLAASSTVMLTWMQARHMAVYVLALALALGQSGTAASWLAAAQRPLMLYALTLVVAAASFNHDVGLYGEFVDRRLRPGAFDVARLPERWPQSEFTKGGVVTYFKWAAGPDYVRDVVIPEYDWYRLTLAFYSYFRSRGESVLYHALDHRKDWIPFECDSLARLSPRDNGHRAFVAFLAEHYCVR